jgi:hypothetical protein
MADVFVYFAKLPSCVKEVVTPCADGCFTIYINDQLTFEGRMLAYGHAVHHIKNNDFNGFDVQEIESKAHYIERR